MPLSCAAYGCTNHNKMEMKPGFYRFPNNDPILRQKWVSACKRQNKDGSQWQPYGKNVYLCGKHFISGKPERKNPDHPDHVPSIFVVNKQDRSSSENKIKRGEPASRRKQAAEVKSSNVKSASSNMLNSSAEQFSELTKLRLELQQEKERRKAAECKLKGAEDLLDAYREELRNLKEERTEQLDISYKHPTSLQCQQNEGFMLKAERAFKQITYTKN